MIARLFRYLFGRRAQPASRPAVAPIASHVPSCDCMICTNLQIRASCEFVAQHPQHCGHLCRDVLTPTGVTRVRIVVMQEPAFQAVFGDVMGPTQRMPIGGGHDS